MEENKDKISDATKELSERLLYQPKSVWDSVDETEWEKIFALGEDYKSFLDAAKTERLAVSEIVRRAKEAGFTDEGRKGGKGEKPLKKLYKTDKKKAAALVVPGKADPTEGLNVIVSHIDSPRLDLKQRPLYEEVELALLKTHYYGGIKKYSWVSRPLAIYGVIVKGDGTEVEVAVGDDPDDPVFTVSDLLIHLAGKAQMEKKVGEAVPGEKLNLLFGSIPFEDKEAKERVKLFALKLLNDKYNIVEEDLISAEIEVVPVGRSRDIGLDRSLVGGYGQDDRASAFTSLRGVLDAGELNRTAVVYFLDKEEIGSEGVTGARGRFIEDVALEILTAVKGEFKAGDLMKTLSNSRCLSADVNGALDPDWQEVHEKRNAARLGYGVCITKFTGSRGKFGASDAHAELVGSIRKLFNDNDVVWQFGELGKVDEGGGGTIAKDMAARGMDVLDCGPVLLDMHSPFEISSKADIYMAYKGYKVFLES
ncbi:MAG: aminopeptidase [Deltaproteobacteria bacterium]|uniref:M18 family aminopeptidase n=1 Tax=Candidatus Zymogenus saltonus TaxID=2844893 RepID=A0A9D8PQ04_9DELT|nr:aminopeptidase [Candidatus Zymogenus saltonus]